jgi:RimJ/RimL family protein N-acetyltransferase
MADEVRLRDVDEGDLETFYEYEHDQEAVARSRFTPRDHDAFMKHWTTTVLGDPANLVQTVTVAGEPAGNIVSWWEKERRFVGYWLGRRYWGRGVGTAALAQYLQKETIRPLYADPFSGNTGSIRILEKCGFQRAGTVRYGDDEHVLLVLDGR